MEINLKEARQVANITIKEAAKAAGINESFYKQYEEKNEIPCKYAFKIWEAFNDFPLPKDFFYYTSYTLRANMTYYDINQTEVAKIFGYSSQGAMSRILSDNIPMYEMKDLFLSTFKPLIVPMKHKGEGHLTYITALIAKGNFMSRKAQEGVNDENVKIIITEPDE